jgi:uracil-DNA glycosylase
MNFSVDINPKNPDLCPPKDQMFRALTLTPLEKVKVVIIGEHPYSGENQANGLAFSVNKNMQLPQSLQNMFKEIKEEFGIENTSGDLTPWAEQGVLLLNVVLTCLKGQGEAHYGKGWEQYTDTIIKQLNDQREKVIFVCLGEKAQEKIKLINMDNHFVLPKEYMFYNINVFLKDNGFKPIDWKT